MQWNVVDPRLQAGRGEEFSASKQKEVNNNALDDFNLPINQKVEDALDTEGMHQASPAEAIPQSNKGFQMLQKMGWKGDGLGSKEDGIVAPITGGAEAGVRLGLGKQEEDDFYTASDNVQRRRLEVEVQAEEDEQRALAREMRAENLQRIQAEVTDIRRTFYCEVCRKQYNSASELEIHLDSYDHHHRKRMVEMRSDDRERTKRDRDRREKKRQEKEMARLNQQIQAAGGRPSVKDQPISNPPLPPDSPSLPPLPEIEPPPPQPEPIPSIQANSQSPSKHSFPELQGGNMGSDMKHGTMQFSMAPTSILPKSVGKSSNFGLRNAGIQKVSRMKSKVAAFADDSDEEND